VHHSPQAAGACTLILLPDYIYYTQATPTQVGILLRMSALGYDDASKEGFAHFNARTSMGVDERRIPMKSGG
jgi:hypothetical protein